MILREDDLPEFKKYPDVIRMEKRMGIFDVDKVVVTEKIHGRNFRIKVTPEGLILGSREITIQGSNHKQFGRFIPIIEQYAERIGDYFMPFVRSGKEVVIFGEVYGGTKMKGCKYQEEANFRVFDIYIDKFLDWNTVVAMAEDIGLPIVPFFYEGVPDLNKFTELVGKSSLTEDENGGEGIVIKAYGYHDHNGSPLFVKMVADRFAEAKSAPKVISAEKLAHHELCNNFASTFVTEARIDKLVEKLKERNLYTGEMTDMKNLIPLLWEDLEKEELDVIQELYAQGVDKKQLNGACTKLLGKMYGALENDEKVSVDTEFPIVLM
jgi:hypothetical protein